jgi:MFS transporter, ACS family, hexuronate transporter
MAGAISGAVISEVVGFVLTTTGSYTIVFGMFSVAYVLAWIILKIGIPEIRPIEL